MPVVLPGMPEVPEVPVSVSPGVSGGGVLNQDGNLVGIPIGRMQGDYRFSFILPIRPEMFRKVPGLAVAEAKVASATN